MSARGRSGTATNGAPKPKKRTKKSKTLQSTADNKGGVGAPKESGKQDWGIFEPARALLEPCIDIIQPVLTGNVMYGLLVGLLVASWFGFGFMPKRNAAPFGADMGLHRADRLAAYEEMWRREDTELWDWLEERVGLDRLHVDSPVPRKKPMEPRSVEEKLREERMDEREVEEAIKVTEEKLKVLRDVMGKTTDGEQDRGVSHAP